MANLNARRRGPHRASARPAGGDQRALVIAGCEHDDVRWALIEDVCAACSAQSHRLTRLDDVVAQVAANDYAAAVVALHDAPEGAHSTLDAVARLKDIGLTVIAHECGVSAWPVRSRCQVLLAGARYVLDSADPGFRAQLHATLRDVLCALRERRDEEQRLRALAREHGIVGRSESLLDAFRQVVRTAKLSDLPVLITGESGTGKELFASALHALDPKRCGHPLVAVNCAAISIGVAESELFGHVRGAFTGAGQDHRGLFLAAQGGVLFLDEIGELNVDVQAKLLRVLQERRVSRVGAEMELPVDIRVVAATNQDLARMVKEGRFRADLLHRLDTLCIHIAPLRERTDDLRPLVDHFLEERVANAAPPAVDPDLIDALACLELKGNVRELRNLIVSALAGKSDQGALGLKDLPARVWEELTGSTFAGAPAAAPVLDERPGARMDADDGPSLALEITHREGWNLNRCLAQCEREIVKAAMQRTRNNQSQAARLLGVTPRSIYNKLRKHQLLAKSLA
jgi:transcriptional regulator with GAF, ATPase, and Fis domain